MELKKKTIEFVSRAALPIMLASVIVNMVLRCYYYEMRGPFTLLYAVCATGAFLLFDQLKKRKIIGFLAYTALLAGVVYLSTRLSVNGWHETHIVFTDWFYLNRDTAGFSLHYFLYLYIFGGFFLVSIIYYFTQIRFRSLGIMLCLLFPFVIYAKRADIMSNFDVTMIITLFLAIVVHNRQLMEKQSGVKTVRDIPYFVSVALFVSFAGAVAMLLPKPTVKSVLERDSHAFDIVGNTNNSNDYSSLTKISANRFGASYTNKILFYAQSDYPDDTFFLKRQAFDDFTDEAWHNDRTNEKYSNYDYYSYLDTDRLTYYNAIKKLADSGRYSEYGLTSESFKQEQPVHYSLRLYDDEFKSTYLPAPIGVIAGSFSKSHSDLYYLYADGQLLLKNSQRKFDYTVSYYPETQDLIDSARNIGMTSDQYYSMLVDAYDNGDEDAGILLEQYMKNIECYTGQIEYTERIRDLAFSITKDCKSDFEKAQALVKYFENNGYTYDMEYEPPDTSIEYFIFEGKTGICTSYATAMAMMARIVGLPARYVEGFAVYETDDDGTFIVRDAHAHAYVEVFIPCAGWLVFDPTVAGYAVDRSEGGGFSFSDLAGYLSSVFVFLAVLFFVFLIIMFDRIAEAAFRLSQKFVKGDRRIIRLYARIVKLLEYSSDEDLSPYTGMMLSDFAKEYNNADIDPVREAFERTCFGCIPLDDAAYDAAYAHYKSIYPKLRKRPRSEKVKIDKPDPVNAQQSI